MGEPVSARDRMHIKRCMGRCVIESDQPDADCQNLDHLLTLVEEQALHAKANAFRNEAQMYESEASGARTSVEREGYLRTAGVFAQAAHELDPYERRSDGSLVRKSDGSSVTVPGEKK